MGKTVTIGRVRGQAQGKQFIRDLERMKARAAELAG